MAGFFGRAITKARHVADLGREELAYRVLPNFFLDIIQRYLRIETEGIENIPKTGPGIVIANHSGFMAFDALMLGHQIRLGVHRTPKLIAHKLWFIRPEISVRAHKLGLEPATFENGKLLLEKKKLLILFPEGEEGNFKPSAYSYRLRRFRRGFLRLALTTGAPIIPATVVGAEETHITLSQIRWAQEVGVLIPIPLNVLPLPAKWRIKFHKPIQLEQNPAKATDLEYLNRVGHKIRRELQRELHAELKRRDSVFF